jgi:hypothetical protein
MEQEEDESRFGDESDSMGWTFVTVWGLFSRETGTGTVASCMVGFVLELELGRTPRRPLCFREWSTAGKISAALDQHLGAPPVNLYLNGASRFDHRVGSNAEIPHLVL